MRIAIAIVLAIAIVGAIAWQQLYSHDARIAHAYDTCLKQFGGAPEVAKSPPPPAAAGNAPVALADTLGKAMKDLVKGVTAGMSGAVCGAVRDACKADFDGAVCQNALAGFR